MMNHRAMLALAEKYTTVLQANGAEARRANLDAHFSLPEDRAILLSHVRWQLEVVRRVLDRIGGEPTAIRLLGSAQGLLVATGLITIGEVSRDNHCWLNSTSIRAFDSVMSEPA